MSCLDTPKLLIGSEDERTEVGRCIWMKRLISFEMDGGDGGSRRFGAAFRRNIDLQDLGGIELQIRTDLREGVEIGQLPVLDSGQGGRADAYIASELTDAASTTPIREELPQAEQGHRSLRLVGEKTFDRRDTGYYHCLSIENLLQESIGHRRLACPWEEAWN